MKRIDELNSPLNTASELEGYLKKVKDLYRDLYMELTFAAEVLQQNLATLPVIDSRANGGILGGANSRLRARRVANQLRKAAEASKYAGGQSVKTWREFTRAFAPEIDAKRAGSKRPKFEVGK